MKKGKMITIPDPNWLKIFHNPLPIDSIMTRGSKDPIRFEEETVKLQELKMSQQHRSIPGLEFDQIQHNIVKQFVDKINREQQKLIDAGINIYNNPGTLENRLDHSISFDQHHPESMKGMNYHRLTHQFMIAENDMYKYAFIDGVLDDPYDKWREKSYEVAMSRVQKKIDESYRKYVR